MPSTSLAGRVARAGLWLTALGVTSRVVGMIRIVVLARLLAPTDFGLAGVAVVTLSLLESLSVTATNLTLFRAKLGSRALLDAAWTLSVVRGCLLACAMFAAAGPIAAAFAVPEACGIVRVMALVPLIAGLRNIGVVEHEKDLSYGPRFRMEVVATLADVCVALPLAVWLENAWALVGGYVALTLARVAMSYAVHPYRPRLHYDRAQMGALLQFAPWVAATALAEWILSDGVMAVTGQVLGVEALGLYLVAWRLTGQQATTLKEVVSAATLPAFASIEGQQQRAQEAFVRVLGTLSATAVPIVLFAALHTEALVELALSDRWSAATPIVRILLAFVLLRTLYAAAAPVLLGHGRARSQACIALAELLTLGALLPPLLSHWATAGAAGATALRALVGAGLALWSVSALLGLAPRRLLSALLVPAVASLPMIAGRVLPGPAEGALALLAQLCLGAVAYALVLLVLARAGWFRLDPLARLIGQRLFAARPPGGAPR